MKKLCKKRTNNFIVNSANVLCEHLATKSDILSSKNSFLTLYVASLTVQLTRCHGASMSGLSPGTSELSHLQVWTKQALYCVFREYTGYGV